MMPFVGKLCMKIKNFYHVNLMPTGIEKLNGLSCQIMGYDIVDLNGNL